MIYIQIAVGQSELVAAPSRKAVWWDLRLASLLTHLLVAAWYAGRLYRLVFVCLSVCLSMAKSQKSTNFGGRYLVMVFSDGVKFGSLIEETFLYVTAQTGELWRKRFRVGCHGPVRT